MTVDGEASPAECEFALSSGPLATAELSADSWSWDSPRVLQSAEAGAIDPSLPDSVFSPPPGRNIGDARYRNAVRPVSTATVRPGKPSNCDNLNAQLARQTDNNQRRSLNRERVSGHWRRVIANLHPWR